MKKSLKILFALFLIIIACGLFILPYGLGVIAQNKYMQLLEMLSKSNTVQILSVEYQRGWFSSEATAKVTVFPGQEEFLLKQHIEHGPIFSLTSKKGQKRLVFGQALTTSEFNPTWGNIQTTTWIKLNGVISGTIEAPKLHYVKPIDKGQVIDLTDLEGIFRISRNFKNVAAHLKIQKIDVKSDKTQQQIDKANVYYKLNKSPSGLFLGQHTLTIDNIISSGVFYPTPLKLAGLKIDLQDVELNQHLNKSIYGELKQFIVNNVAYGPQRIEIDINKIDVPALLALQKEMQYGRAQKESLPSEVQKQQQRFVALLQKGLDIQLKKLEIVTPWGMPTAKGELQFPVVSPAKADISVQKNAYLGQIVETLTSANGTLEVNLPNIFLVYVLESLYKHPVLAASSASILPLNLNQDQPVQQKINALIQKKWLVKTPMGYGFSMSYQDGKITINGQSLRDLLSHPSVENIANESAAPTSAATIVEIQEL